MTQVPEDLKTFITADTDLSGRLTRFEMIAYANKTKNNNFPSDFSKKFDKLNKGYVTIDDISDVLKMNARAVFEQHKKDIESDKEKAHLEFMKMLKSKKNEADFEYFFDTKKKELLKSGKPVGTIKDLIKSGKLVFDDTTDLLYYDTLPIAYLSTDFKFTRTHYDKEKDVFYIDGFPCGDLCNLFEYNALQFGQSKYEVDLNTMYSEKFKQLFCQGRCVGDIDRLYEYGFLYFINGENEDKDGLYYYDMKVGKFTKNVHSLDESEAPKIKIGSDKKLLLSEHISNDTIKMLEPGSIENYGRIFVDRQTSEVFKDGVKLGTFGELWDSGKIKVNPRREIFLEDRFVGYFDDQLPGGTLRFDSKDKKVYAGEISLGEVDNLFEQKSILMKGVDVSYPKTYINNGNVYLDRFFVGTYKDALSKKLFGIDKKNNRLTIGDVEVAKLPENLNQFNLDYTPDGKLTKNVTLEKFVDFYRYCPIDTLTSRSNASRLFIREDTQEVFLDGQRVGVLGDLIKERRLNVDELNEIITLDGIMLAKIPEHILAPGEGKKFVESPISFMEFYRNATATRLCPADGDLFQNGTYIGKISESVSTGDIVYDSSSGEIKLRDDTVAYVPAEFEPIKCTLDRSNCTMKLGDGTSGTIESLLEKNKVISLPKYRSAYINEPLRNIYIFDKNVGTVDSFLKQKKMSIDPLTKSLWCDSVYLGKLPKGYDTLKLTDSTGTVTNTHTKEFLKAYRETSYSLTSLLEGPNKPTYIKFNSDAVCLEQSKLANLKIFNPPSTTSTGAVKPVTTVTDPKVTATTAANAAKTAVTDPKATAPTTTDATKAATTDPKAAAVQPAVQETIISSDLKFLNQAFTPPKGVTSLANTVINVDKQGKIMLDEKSKLLAGYSMLSDLKKAPLPSYTPGYGTIVDNKLVPVKNSKGDVYQGLTLYLDANSKPVLDKNGLPVPYYAMDAGAIKPVAAGSTSSGVPQLLFTDPDGKTNTTSSYDPKAVTAPTTQQDSKAGSTATAEKKPSVSITIAPQVNTKTTVVLPSTTQARDKIEFDMVDPSIGLKINGKSVGTIKDLVASDKIKLNPKTKLLSYENIPIKSLPTNYSYLGLDYDYKTGSIKGTKPESLKLLFNPYKVSGYNATINGGGDTKPTKISTAISNGDLKIDKATNNLMFKDAFLAPINVDSKMIEIESDPSGKVTKVGTKGTNYLDYVTDSKAIFPFIPADIFSYQVKDGKVSDKKGTSVGTIAQLLKDGRFAINKETNSVYLDGKPFTSLPYHYFEVPEWKYDKKTLVLAKDMNPKVLEESFKQVAVDVNIVKQNALFSKNKKIDEIKNLLKSKKITGELKTSTVKYEDKILGQIPSDYGKFGVEIDPKSGQITEKTEGAFNLMLQQGNLERFGDRYSVDYATGQVFLKDVPMGSISTLASKGRFFLDKASHNILLDGSYFCSLPVNKEMILLEVERDNASTITPQSADSLYVVHYMESVTKNPIEQVNVYHRIDSTKKAIYVNNSDPAQSIEEQLKKKAFKLDGSKKEILFNDKWIAHAPVKLEEAGVTIAGDGVVSAKDLNLFTKYLRDQMISSQRLKMNGSYELGQATYDQKTKSFKIGDKENKLEDVAKQNRLWYNPLKEEITLDGHYYKDVCQEHIGEYNIEISPETGFITKVDPEKFNKLLAELETHDHQHAEGGVDHHQEHDLGVSPKSLLLNPDNLNKMSENGLIKIDDYLRVIYCNKIRVGQFAEDKNGLLKLDKTKVLIGGKDCGTLRENYDKGLVNFNYEDIQASESFKYDQNCMEIDDCHEAFYQKKKAEGKIEFFDKTKVSGQVKKDFDFSSLDMKVPKNIMTDIIEATEKSYGDGKEERTMAHEIKNAIEKKRGKIWHVVISNQNLGCKVSHMEDMFANFNYKGLTYLIWKTPRCM